MAASSSAPLASSSSGTFYDPCSSSNGQDSESDGDTGKGREEKEVASLLDRLRSQTPADIARSRKIRSNQPPDPPRGKRTCRGALASDPKGVTPRHYRAGLRRLRKLCLFSHHRPLLKESFHYLNLVLEINRTTLLRIM